MNLKREIVLILMIILINSCDTKQKNTKQEESSTLVKTAASVNKNDSINNQIDTIPEQESAQNQEEFHSHMSIDYAKITEEILDSSLVEVFDSVCVLSVIPDTSYMNKQEKESGDGWNEVVSDHQYYEYEATKKLEEHGILEKVVHRDNKRYLKFIKTDNSYVVYDFTKMLDAWGLILFNGTDDPVLWNSTDIDEELKEIYKK